MNSLQAQSLFSVTGKVVLVTGGSRGIGEMVSTARASKAPLLTSSDCLRLRQKWRNRESLGALPAN